jgi:Ca-activated chloride channel homolog
MSNRIIKLLVLVLLSASSCFASGTLNGTIIDSESRDQIPFARVQLLDGSRPVSQTVTDINGKYEFRNIAEGLYIIEVNVIGYKRKLIPNVKVTNSIVTTRSIELEPLEIVIEELIIDSECEESVSRDIAPMNNTVIHGMIQRSVKHEKKDRSYQLARIAPVPNNTEQYDVIKENRFRNVSEHPLSTFSVDVDRASYANIRRFLRNNQMPPKDAVRVEEMINYFNYDYDQPESDDPFSINLEMGACPWNSKNELLLVGLQGKNMNAEEAPPGNLVFLIDVSGSMNSPNKLPLLKSSFKILVDNLRPSDRVAIVVYAGAAGLVLNSVDGRDKSKIYDALDRLNSGGSTAGGAGIRLAYKIARENHISGGNNRVILATDGDFNVGESSDASMVRLIEEKRKEGVYLTVLGFGMGNYKDSKMEKISNAGNGNYAYIDNILEAKKIFGKELFGTLFTIAKDVKFQIEFNPAIVSSYRLVGYENRLLNKEDFNDDTKDAGEIGAGHTVTALYEIVPVKSADGIYIVDPLDYQENISIDTEHLMTLKLRYKKPEESKSHLIRQQIKKDDIFKDIPDNNLLFASSVASFGMLLRDSKYKTSLTYNKVVNMLKQAKGMDEEGYRSELIALVETAEQLNRGFSSLRRD